MSFDAMQLSYFSRLPDQDRNHDGGRGAMTSPMRILVFVPHTVGYVGGSGIQRVTRQVAEALMAQGSIDLVKWDSIDGQLRYLSATECDRFFRSPTWPRAYSVNRFAGRRRYRFADTIPDDGVTTWLLLPEIFYHVPDGMAVYRSLLAQARAYRWRTAAIFYDLIPITNSDYAADLGAQHALYVRELLKLDLVVPISHFSGNELRRYEAETFGIDDVTSGRMRRDIVPVPLAGTHRATREERGSTDELRRDVILLVGTVEPRKQQLRVLQAFRARDLALRYGLKIVLIGSLHPKCAPQLAELLADPAIEFCGYLTDEQIADYYSRARFSVFASHDEGFGLPIIESLAHGVPCLTADFGAMREVGEGGGCLFVDVLSQSALENGLERMSGDDALVAELRAEIDQRRLRTWDDYGRDLRDALRRFDESASEQRIVGWMLERIAAFRSGSAQAASWCGPSDDHWLLSRMTSGVSSPFAAIESVVPIEPAVRRALFAQRDALPESNTEIADPDAIFGVDLWILEDQTTFERLVDLARSSGYPGLLPTRSIVLANASDEATALADVARYGSARAKREINAARESVYCRAARQTPQVAPPALTIVISTYNRAPFVAENVRWLATLVPKYQGRVRVVVVDNASTDDTGPRLDHYRNLSFLEIVRNPTNVGMLGNLQVCSALIRSEYTWVIGDDDYIVPEALDIVLEAITVHPAVPFLFTNFGVYHRTALQPGDRADTLIHDPTILAPEPSPSGLYPVKAIAGEHDNLFTAIYPIVFRTDILSACFNYTFTGKPFGSIVESIPTTKIILEEYGEVEAYWIATVGIVGNAHNSWQRYRVPWHGVLMPIAFELAKETGVDPQKLQDWGQVHRQLYEDAMIHFPEESIQDRFGRKELDASFRVFRETIFG